MSIRAMFVGNAPPATLALKPADTPQRPLTPAHGPADPATLPTGEAAAPAQQSAQHKPPAAPPRAG